MASIELAQILLRKAEQDEYAIEKLAGEPDAPDELIGFHAQQATEKLLKAVLAARGIRYRKTHDLVELIDLLKKSGIPYPQDVEDLRFLTPFATDLRYVEVSALGTPKLDRDPMRARLRTTRTWAEHTIGEAQ